MISAFKPIHFMMQGEVKGTVKAADTNNTEIMCINLDFKLQD